MTKNFDNHLKKEFEKMEKVWNLKILAERLLCAGSSNPAYTIRQVLDLISSNWREAKDYLELEVNI